MGALALVLARTYNTLANLTLTAGHCVMVEADSICSMLGSLRSARAHVNEPVCSVQSKAVMLCPTLCKTIASVGLQTKFWQAIQVNSSASILCVPQPCLQRV